MIERLVTTFGPGFLCEVTFNSGPLRLLLSFVTSPGSCPQEVNTLLLSYTQPQSFSFEQKAFAVLIFAAGSLPAMHSTEVLTAGEKQ